MKQKAFLVAQCEDSTCQCRRHRFIPWSGRIPRASEQLSPCATTTEQPLLSETREKAQAATAIRKKENWKQQKKKQKVPSD